MVLQRIGARSEGSLCAPVRGRGLVGVRRSECGRRSRSGAGSRAVPGPGCSSRGALVQAFSTRWLATAALRRQPGHAVRQLLLGQPRRQLHRVGRLHQQRRDDRHLPGRRAQLRDPAPAGPWPADGVPARHAQQRLGTHRLRCRLRRRRQLVRQQRAGERGYLRPLRVQAGGGVRQQRRLPHRDRCDRRRGGAHAGVAAPSPGARQDHEVPGYWWRREGPGRRGTPRRHRARLRRRPDAPRARRRRGHHAGHDQRGPRPAGRPVAGQRAEGGGPDHRGRPALGPLRRRRHPGTAASRSPWSTPPYGTCTPTWSTSTRPRTATRTTSRRRWRRLPPRRRTARILYYQSPSTTSFTPNVFVDVEDTVRGKIDSLRAHWSQVMQCQMVDLEAVEAGARYWGSRAKISYAEAFETPRFVWDIAPSAAKVQPAARSRQRPPIPYHWPGSPHSTADDRGPHTRDHQH